MRLSHSSSEKYKQCGYKWKLYYKDKLRSNSIGSALFFGSALDEAFSRLLLEKKKNLTEEETKLMEKTAFEIFHDELTETKVNGKTVNIKTFRDADYFKSDCDVSLLSQEDLDEVKRYAKKNNLTFKNNDDIKNFVKEFQGLKEYPDEEKLVYNYICWYSLLRKGNILIEAYEKDVIPLIEEVFSIQEMVKLKDGDDIFVGFIDVIASFTDEPGIKYIIDNKTSSKAYKQDSVRNSLQLSAYSEYKNTNKAAYIVVEKKLRKREPRTRIQIIRDEIPEEMFDKTFDELTEVFYNIESELFDQNWDACFNYGRKCEYFDYCRYNNAKGLVDLNKKDV